MNEQPLKIAVIGSGVAGLTATHILQRKHKVTLFEKEWQMGGHTHTEIIPSGPDEGTPVDTGFIVMNHRNYPLFTQLLEQLGVDLQESDMSFGYHDLPSNLQYCGNGLDGLFAQRKNMFDPSFLKMVADISRFFRFAEKDLASPSFPDETLRVYLTRRGLGEAFINHHLIPMGSAIWSTPCEEMMRFPAQSFLQFFQNHGLLSVKNRPQWKTVVGGSQTYIDRMLASWSDNVHIRLRTPPSAIRRVNNGVEVSIPDGTKELFDHVIIATHADQAFKLLDDPSEEETQSLGCWEYNKSRTILHTDESVMPPLRKIWSSWNFRRIEGDKTCLTYDMNRLQNLQTKQHYFVSLNLPHDPEGIIREYRYEHPMFTKQALFMRPKLYELNGVRNTWFVGSYFGNGFHEDAVRSAVKVAERFGIGL